MNLYNCLIKFDNNKKIKDLVIIKDGFSFKAFLFNPFWFLFHKMWKEFFYSCVIVSLFALFSKFIFEASWLEFTMFFIFALNSKSWLIEHLMTNKKYQLVAMIFAKGETDAKVKLLSRIYENSKQEFQESFVDAILVPKKNKKTKFKYFL